MKISLSRLSNKDLIETAFEYIETETGYHILDKNYIDTYFFFEGEEDSICHFHIKEIPGFLFAFWNTSRFDKIEDQIKRGGITWADSLEVPTNSELIFFTQFERDLDKFKPSRSGFVTGIFREAYETDNGRTESWYAYDLISILQFMNKHPLAARHYAQLQITKIWEQWNAFTIIKETLKDNFYYYKYRITEKRADKKLVNVIKKFIGKLTCFNYILCDRGDSWSPKYRFLYCRKKEVEPTSELYLKELEMLDNFYDTYWNKIDMESFCYEDTRFQELNDKELEEKFNNIIQNILKHPTKETVIKLKFDKLY